MRKAECKMEGSAAQCIDQGMPAQCTGRQVSPRVESCVRWQDSTIFKEILEHAAANGGTRSGQLTAQSLFQSHQTSSHILRMCLSAVRHSLYP